MESQSKLLPVLRDAVNIVKIVLFKQLKTRLANYYPSDDSSGISRLAAAVVNEVFGTPNASPRFARFAADNHRRISDEMNGIAKNFNHLRPLLTDALRIQFLCDSLEGRDSGEMLVKADSAGILLKKRETPLPKTFMAMVRRVGAAHNILESATVPDKEMGNGVS